METLKKVVTNQYFPAGAVLTAVLLFWIVGMLGGLSLLNNNQPPLTTLTWMLFVYAAAVLTPLAGLLAGVDLVRRWRRNRAAGPVLETEAAGAAEALQAQPEVSHPAQPDPSEPLQQGAAHGTQPKAQRPGRQEAA